MGCSESKINNLTSVDQCKEKIAYMKQSVLAHGVFISAHFTYAAAVKNITVALCDYAQSEFQSLDDRTLGPHGRYCSIHPHLQSPPNNSRVLVWDFFLALMEDARYMPSSAVIDDNRGGIEKPVIQKKVVDNSFANNQGMRVLNGEKLDFSFKKKESHATLLDKMLAWEKRLYDQVKAGEKIKFEYQKKMALQNKHRKHGISNNKLKQTEATVSHLHATYIVAMQSIDSTVEEINRLRDQHLYPKLVQTIEEMEEMWKNMQKQHEQQLKITQRLLNIKNSQLPNDTSDRNLKNIKAIHLHLTIWCCEFEKLMLHQNEFVKSLNNWLKLNLISTDHNVKPQNPKIESLLRTWNDHIEKLPENRAKTAISSFAGVIAAIVRHHSDEMEMKKRCNEIRREITRRTRRFEEWCDKQILKRKSSDEMDVDVIDDVNLIAEQQVVVEVLKRRLEVEEEVYRRCRVQVKDTALVNLTAAVPEFSTAMMEFSGACLMMYGRLKSQCLTAH